MVSGWVSDRLISATTVEAYLMSTVLPSYSFREY